MDEEYKPKWQNRQKVIFGTLFFCALVVIYLLIFGEGNSELHQTIAMWAFLLSGAVIGSYVFGAAWEDVTKLRK